jgi:hypothetical protein
MKAWIDAENAAQAIAFPFHIVFNRSEAVELNENNAHEVLRAAEGSYRDYTWRVEKVREGVYIVEGTQK